MKVLLINPYVAKMHDELSYAENFRPPLGLAYCASILEQAGHEVVIEDALVLGTKDKALVKKLLRLAPDLVGISVYSPTRYEAFRTAQLVRDTLGKSVPIVTGGPHVSVAAEDTLKHVPAVDYVVSGEGELTLRELVKMLAAGGNVAPIAGLFSRGPNGELITGPARGNVLDLDDIPQPARHLLPMGRYGTRLPSTMHVATTLLTSRGCPARCTFCTRDWFSRETRMHSPTYILDEIESIIEQHGIRTFIFQDDTFTLNKKRIRGLCDGIAQRGLKIKWLATTRVDCLDLELMKQMQAAGCIVVTFGAESMNPATLRWLKKGFSVEQVKQAVDWAFSIGLTVRCSYLLGIGDETEADLRHSLKAARELRVSKLKANVGLSVYPGTPLYPMAIEAGVLSADFSFAEGWQDSDKRYGNGEAPRWYTPHVSLKLLLELRKETEVNMLFTRPSSGVLLHRVRKFAHRFRSHPQQTTLHALQFARAALAGSRLRS